MVLWRQQSGDNTQALSRHRDFRRGRRYTWVMALGEVVHISAKSPLTVFGEMAGAKPLVRGRRLDQNRPAAAVEVWL